MHAEMDEVSQLVDKYCALDPGADSYGDGRFVVRAGKNRRSATMAGSKLSFGEREAVLRALRQRIKMAQQTGERRIYVEVYESSGAKHPEESIELEGDPISIRDAEEDDRPSNMNASAALSLQILTQANFKLMERCLDLAEDKTKLSVQAAIPLTELEVRNQLGYQQGLRDAAVALAPALEKAAPAVVALVLAHTRPAEGGDPGTTAGRLRMRVSAIEREVAIFGLELKSAADAKELTPMLQAELQARLGALVQQFMAGAAAGGAA